MVASDEPNLPFCGNGCIRRMELYAQESRPVEMLVFGCRACKDCIICTRIPFADPPKWSQSLFKNVSTKEDVIKVIEQESFRLGLSKPKVLTK